MGVRRKGVSGDQGSLVSVDPDNVILTLIRHIDRPVPGFQKSRRSHKGDILFLIAQQPQSYQRCCYQKKNSHCRGDDFSSAALLLFFFHV